MIDIINNALNYLGQQSIQSVDEQNDRARKCKQFYDVARLELLRKQDWGFAQEEVILNKLPKENYLERKFVYAYPEKALFIKKIYSKESIRLRRNFEYRVATLDGQKVICSNEREPRAIITKDVQDTTLFDATFKEALAYLLASKVAMALTGDAEIYRLAVQQFQISINDATLVNKQEEPTVIREESDFWRVR